MANFYRILTFEAANFKIDGLALVFQNSIWLMIEIGDEVYKYKIFSNSNTSVVYEFFEKEEFENICQKQFYILYNSLTKSPQVN